MIIRGTKITEIIIIMIMIIIKITETKRTETIMERKMTEIITGKSNITDQL